MKSDWERSAGMLAEPNRWRRWLGVQRVIGDEDRHGFALAVIKGTTEAVGTALPKPWEHHNHT